MSRWQPAQIAKWAKDAGWEGEQLVTAVAQAMASSGGDDHHSSNPGWHPSLERRGLWALRACEVPAVDPGALYDPVVNARAAHAHWEDMGGTWAWHPVWVSGATIEAIPHIRLVLADPKSLPGPGAPSTFAAMLDYRARFHTAMQQQRSR